MWRQNFYLSAGNRYKIDLQNLDMIDPRRIEMIMVTVNLVWLKEYYVFHCERSELKFTVTNACM